MTPTHTPGPWFVSGPVSEIVWSEARGNLSPVVASCITSDQDGQDQANAVLVSAAPDLLQACEAALPALSAHAQTGCNCPDSEAARLLRSAIDKAIGEEDNAKQK